VNTWVSRVGTIKGAQVATHLGRSSTQQSARDTFKGALGAEPSAVGDLVNVQIVRSQKIDGGEKSASSQKSFEAKSQFPFEEAVQVLWRDIGESRSRRKRKSQIRMICF